MELIEIINILQQEYPNKVIVDLSEYESEEHQTYKYLFEQLSQKYAEKLNEVGMLATDQQNYEKEIAELSQKNASLAAQMESVNQSTINSLGVIKEYVNLGIVVSDIMIRLLRVIKQTYIRKLLKRVYLNFREYMKESVRVGSPLCSMSYRSKM